MIDIKRIGESLKRNTIWVLPAIISIFLLSPAKQEIRTFLLISSVECMALLLSAIAAKVYTVLDFTKTASINLGFIFIGVHLCVGLTVLGVYIAQFTP